MSTQIREGASPRSENNITGEGTPHKSQMREGGGTRSYHSPTTICPVTTKEGATCKGKVTSAGKCFAHVK